MIISASYMVYMCIYSQGLWAASMDLVAIRGDLRDFKGLYILK